ncbi:MAG TPA: pyridoxamine 5'-phosphate oxidase family protein [Jatrophihabitans sp.]|nr:pyridoxamine 5'-phosphate oxidase family protein [Jatrophihabitans sp.]
MSLSALSERECLELLTRAEVGRVVVSMQALPVALPVNYWLIDDAIVFRAAPGTKLAAAVSGSVVGFEVDQFDSATHTGWSVLVIGMSRVVTDPAEIAELDRAGLHSWLDIELPEYVSVAVQRVSGRCLGPGRH